MPTDDYIQTLRKKIGHNLLIMPSVTTIHFDREGRILLLKHAATGTWVAPGGSIEPNESPADAAVREMWEETGLQVKLTRILGVFGGPDFLVSYPNGDQTTYIMTVFECKKIHGQLKPRDGEALELSYFSKSELESIDLSPWARIVLPQIFNADQGAIFNPSTWTPSSFPK